jgi:hypothetical protein
MINYLFLKQGSKILGSGSFTSSVSSRPFRFSGLICYLSHPMLINDKALTHWINNFFGYGSWNAGIWFIAHEDGGGNLPEEVSDKLNYFASTHAQDTHPTLCDVRDMYRNLPFRFEGPKAEVFANLYEYRFGRDAKQHGIWKNLIAFVHGYRTQEVPDLLEYQKNLFASPSANNEALIRLYPLPAPHNHAWYYSWLDMPKFGFLKSRELYEEHLLQRRIHGILDRISAHKPELVLMYGMSNINRLKESVQAFFPGTKFTMIKAIKRQIPQHHRVDINETRLLITTQIPALRHNRIETGFDWEVFGKMVNRAD